MIIEKTMTLPKAMNVLKQIPIDPGQQKAWAMQALQSAKTAQMKILQDYRSSPEIQEDEPARYSADDHHGIMSGLLDHYQSRGHGRGLARS